MATAQRRRRTVGKWRLWAALTVLAVVSALAVVGMVRATSSVRDEARQQFFDQYNRQQLLLAEQAARGVEEFFVTLQRSLNLAVSLFDDRPVTAERAEAVRGTLDKLYESLADEDTAVVDLVVFDAEGQAVSVNPPDPYTFQANYAWRNYFTWARDEGRPGEFYLSPFMRMEGGQHRGAKGLIMAEGIYGPGGVFKGVAIFAVNFNVLARKHVLSVRIGKEGYGWLVDTKDEMVLVAPSGHVDGKTFEEAFLPKWQGLYDLLVGMKDGRQGTGTYVYEDPADPSKTVRKLVGYHPIRIGGRLWTLGVATPEREVEGLLSSFLESQETFSRTLAIAILGGTLALSAVLLMWNRMLSRQVARRTADLDAARSELESTFHQLLASKKLAAIGQLALGLAHEIRNPLSAIQMNVRMIRRKHGAEGPMRENFEIVDGQIQRLNRLLTDVMDFARPKPLRLEECDLSAIVVRVTALMAQRLEDEGITLELDLAEGLDLVCDPEQIEQALLNLVLNASDSMAGQAGPKTLTITGRREGPAVRLDVADTGQGFGDMDGERLFDPLFTTKSDGMGLGLSTLQSIVHLHRGTVVAHNRGGGGAVFVLRLPVGGADCIRDTAA